MKINRNIPLYVNSPDVSYLLRLLNCFVFCILSSTLVFGYPDGWSDDILLTPEDDADRERADIAVDTFSNVWVVWDSTSWTAGEIYYTKRDSMGAEIIPETNISNNSTKSGLAKIASSISTSVHIIWRDMTALGIGVWHAKLGTDGSVMVPAHSAVDGAGTYDCSLVPGLAVSKYHELNIIWDEQPGVYREMYWTRLDSMGEPLLDKVHVSPENIHSAWPGIGVDSLANIHCGFRTNVTSTDSLTYTKLDRNGTILIDSDVLGSGLLPTFVVDYSQDIHVVFMDPVGPGISVKYIKLDQAGNILVWPRVLSIHESNSSPHMALDSLQYLHVVWHVSQNQGGVMYAKLDTLGEFVIPPLMIVTAPPAVYPAYARVVADVSNRLHVVWQDQRLDPGVVSDIYYKRGENEQAVEEWSTNILQDQYCLSASPNPFRDVTYIRIGWSDGSTFSSNAADRVESMTLRIYDVTGRHVRSFHITPDVVCNTLQWDGKDQSNRKVPEGVYHFVLKNSCNIITKKIVKLQ